MVIFTQSLKSFEGTSVISSRAGSSPSETRSCRSSEKHYLNNVFFKQPPEALHSSSEGNLHVFQHQRLMRPYHLGTVILSKCPHIRSTITLCGSQLLQKRHIFWIDLGSDLYKLSLITSAQDPPWKCAEIPPKRASAAGSRTRT